MMPQSGISKNLHHDYTPGGKESESHAAARGSWTVLAELAGNTNADRGKVDNIGRHCYFLGHRTCFSK